MALARLVLHVEMAVEHDEGAVFELPERVDLGERHVVLLEEPHEPRRDAGQRRQIAACDAERGDQLLRAEVRVRHERREVLLRDMVRVLLGDLLDVDAAHVAEDHDRLLGERVVRHAEVVLLRDRGLRLDGDADGKLVADRQLQDLGGGLGCLLGRVGELHAAGLHAPAGEHLRLEDDGRVQFSRKLPGLLGRARGAAVGQGDAHLREEELALEFVEAHQPRSPPKAACACALCMA